MYLLSGANPLPGNNKREGKGWDPYTSKFNTPGLIILRRVMHPSYTPKD